MKLYNELQNTKPKPKIFPRWGSMDPDDQPNPLSKDPEPINQTNKQQYAPKHEINMNGQNMTPTVHAKNSKMANEFAELVKNYINKNVNDVVH